MLSEDGKAIKFVCKRHVAIDGIVLCQKTLSLCEDFSQGSCEMSGTKPCTASTLWSHRFRNTFGIASSHVITRRWVSMAQQDILREKKKSRSYNFYYSFYYNCSILSVIAANLLLCLVYKLNFICIVCTNRKQI